MSHNIVDTNERSTPTEPFELEEEQRQQVDAIYDIDIHRPISIDVVTRQPLDVAGPPTWYSIDSASSS